ncbi:hypothetical protein [Pseudarthrobacter sp. NamB4]|uniref:hypothetical protein n=1 Tax=Pseudarthrobacter sp. NamB4 TaxID=2576837 RepID=UPI001F10B941|nr:hypothetical protein [Pseudarthrobacter sp. NamB4]
MAGRPLFAIVTTYLAVAGLAAGTLIAFGLGTGLSHGTVLANQPQYRQSEPLSQRPTQPEYTCVGPLQEQPAMRTERVAWLLSMNPYVVVADAIPYRDRTAQHYSYMPAGAIENISQGARHALAGPEGSYPCANGEVKPQYLSQTTPLWPLGLVLQLALAGLLLWLGWRSLRTPARRLAPGTRVA